MPRDYKKALMINVMAKRTGRKPKHPESHNEATGRSGQAFTMRLDPDLLTALEQFVKDQKFRTTKTDVIEVALQEMLKAEHYWPPKPSPAEESG